MIHISSYCSWGDEKFIGKVINVYIPARVSVEVTHPNYAFVSGNFIVDRETSKTVYMLEKGERVRLDTEKGTGRIE